MAWFRCGGGSSSGGGNLTDTVWNGTLIADTYITNNGQAVTYGGWSATDYLDLNGSAYVYRVGKIAAVNYNAFYDSNKTFISFFGADSIRAVPSNAKYVRFSGVNSDMTGKIIIECS